MSVLLKAESKAHPGFWWLLAINNCGCAISLRRPIRKDGVETAVRMMSEGEDFDAVYEAAPTDDPMISTAGACRNV